MVLLPPVMLLKAICHNTAFDWGRLRLANQSEPTSVMCYGNLLNSLESPFLMVNTIISVQLDIRFISGATVFDI